MASHHHLLHRPVAPSIAALEERITAQQRDLQTLLLDNQRLAATHVALKQDLAVSTRDLSLLAEAAERTKVEKENKVRELYERSVRIEEEARRLEAARAELAVVRADVTRLAKERDEMKAKAEELKEELGRVKGEKERVEEVKWEMEYMRNEIVRGRAAVEYEKKAHAENLEQSQKMEKDMVTMARELEKLHAELANAEKRARATAAVTAASNPGPAYPETYRSNEIAYGGSTYANSYGYHQAPRVADGASPYGLGAVLLGPYDIQQTQAHR